MMLQLIPTPKKLFLGGTLQPDTLFPNPLPHNKHMKKDKINKIKRTEKWSTQETKASIKTKQLHWAELKGYLPTVTYCTCTWTPESHVQARKAVGNRA